MQLSENIRYNSSWNDSINTESTAPTLSLLINNELFNFDLTGTANNNRTTEGPNRNSHSWDSRIDSAWDKILWPNLQFNYGQTYAENDQNPRGREVESSQTGVTVDWDMLVADVYYNYNDQVTEDLVSKSEISNTTQIARIDFDIQKSFLDNAINTTFYYQFSTTRQDFTTKVTNSGFVLIPIDNIESRGASFALLDTDEPEWDDDLNPSPLDVEIDKRYNLAIKVLTDKPDVLYLYTDDDLTDEAHLFVWQVYGSNDGINWTIITPAATYIYENLNQRFELTLPTVTQRYTMLVESDIPTTENFSFSRVEGFKKVLGNIGNTITDTSKTDTQQTDGSISWRLSPDLIFSSSFSLDQSKRDDYEHDKINTNSSLDWTLTEFTSSSLNIGEIREERGDDPKSIKRNYGLSLSSQILPTLDINSTLTRTDNYEDGCRTAIKYNYSILTSAIFFPDLNSTLDLNYQTNKDEDNGDTTKHFTSDLYVTARLFPDLTATLNESYTESRSTDVIRTTSSKINLIWRPSNILSVNAALNKEWQNGKSKPEQYNISIGMAPTTIVQLNMGYNHSEINDTYNLSVNWHINDIFTVNAAARYKDPSTGDALTYLTMLTVRY